MQLSTYLQLFYHRPPSKFWYTVGEIVNKLRPRQNCRYFPNDILKRIFLNEDVLYSIKISLKFVPMGPINNIPALVLIMAWRRQDDKPLSEPMMVSLPTHICIARPQRVKVWCQEPDICTYITFSIIVMDFLNQVNMRLHHFSQSLFNVKKMVYKMFKSWQVGEVVNADWGGGLEGS